MVKGYLPVLHIMGKESPASMGALDGNLRKVQAGSDPADTQLRRSFAEEELERLPDISKWGLARGHHMQGSDHPLTPSLSLVILSLRF